MPAKPTTRPTSRPSTQRPASKMASLKERLAAADAVPSFAEPLWEGPSGDGPNGGVTQGLLGRYVSCAERFRVAYVEGLRPPERFVAPLGYGTMHHLAEEYHQRGEDWEAPLEAHVAELNRKFPFDRDQINHWRSVCRIVFPTYVRFWEQHPDELVRTPLLQESQFDVLYCPPSGRVARLRGKRDAVDLLSQTLAGARAGAGGIYVKEDKTKSQIDQVKVMQQLKFDLQTMVYLLATRVEFETTSALGRLQPGDIPEGVGIEGVRYCVVRRSAHRSNDRGELPGLVKKLAEDEADGRLGEWFARWTVDVSPEDLARFKVEFLDPCLENLADDWEWWNYCFTEGADRWDYSLRARRFPKHRHRHFRKPYGVYDPVSDGGFGDADAYIRDGNAAGLRRAEVVFPELVE